MADLKVNTDLVSTISTNLNVLNTQMNECFSPVASSIQRMDSSWDGSAATKAITKFNEIKNTLIDGRSEVLQGFIQFLYQLVGEGYNIVEDSNISLADTLK